MASMTLRELSRTVQDTLNTLTNKEKYKCDVRFKRGTQEYKVHQVQYDPDKCELNFIFEEE